MSESFALPTRGSRADCLVDTSAAIALLLTEHPHHDGAMRAMRGRSRGLCGHATFETYSVLTRLPSPGRVAPLEARRAIETTFPHSCHLSARQSAELLALLAVAGIAGGAVYDALVGACAREHGLPLVTRDRRAADTYRAVGAAVELLD